MTERSDAYAMAIGQSAEAALTAPDRGFSGPRTVRKSEFDNNPNGANGRARSNDQ